MSKVMKKIIAFCFMAVLTIAMIPQTIKADEATDAKKAVYVQVPQDWENPCVWAWDDDGNNGRAKRWKQTAQMKAGIISGFQPG